MKTTAALLLTLLLIAGCARFGIGAGLGGDPTPDPNGVGAGARPDLAGAWILDSGHGPQGRIEVPDGYRVTLNFDGDQVGGQACNHYGGTYDVSDDGRISFSAMSMTEMACEEPMMMVEAAYHAALAAVTRVSRDGDVLTLSGNQTQLVFELLPPVPDAALQDTRWVLESLIHGEAASSVHGQPRLQLSSDGTLRGSTGCRGFEGEYTISGDQVLAITLTTTDQACAAELVQQDAFVLDVIGDGFMVAIDGDRLTLSKPNGDGLDYRAAGE